MADKKGSSGADSGWGSSPGDPAPKPPKDEGLVEWGNPKRRKQAKKPAAPAPPPAGATPPDSSPWGTTAQTATAKPRRRRRWLRLSLWIGGIAIILLAVLVAFAPMIASALAPGFVESAAATEIAGSVKVSRVSLGWGGPTRVGPVELRDEKGKLVGKVEVTIPVGLWRPLVEGWWSRPQLDLGTIELGGDLDIVQGADGKTNLERALAPRTKAKKPKSQGGGGPGAIKAALKLDTLSVSFTDKSAPPGSALAGGVGISRFGGTITANYDAFGGKAGAGGATLKADLSGTVISGGQPSAEKLRLAADVELRLTAKQAIDKADAKIELTGAPLDLVDSLAEFKGELVKSLGPRAAVTITTSGNLDKADAAIELKSDGAQTDLRLAYADGLLQTAKPGRITIRNTDFILAHKALKSKLDELGGQLKLAGGPSVEVAIDSLKLPIPREALESLTGGTTGASQGAKPAPSFDLFQLDLRRAAITLSAKLGEIRGEQGFDSLSKDPTVPPPLKPFRIEPLTVALTAADLAGPVKLTAGTRASIDGHSAGELVIDLTATELLDSAGHLRKGSLGALRGTASLTGVSTSLAQHILTAAGGAAAKLDLAHDVGPTVDVVLTAAAASGLGAPPPGGAPGAAPEIPPTDLSLRITSANIATAGAFRYADERLTTVDQGLIIDIGTTAPLASRFLATTVALTGTGKTRITISQLSLPYPFPKSGLAPTDMQGELRIGIEDLAVGITMPPAATPAAAAPSAPAGGAPVQVSTVAITGLLKPGSPPVVALNSTLMHDGSPFSLSATLSAPGALDMPEKTAPPAGQIEQLLAFKASGTVELRDVPRSLTRLIPTLDQHLNPPSDAAVDDPAAQAKRLIAALIGRDVDVTVAFDAGDKTQNLRAEVAAAGLGATVAAAIKPDSLLLNSAAIFATLNPPDVNPLLAAVTPKDKPPAAPAGAPAGSPPAPAAAPPVPLPPMTLANAVTLRADVQPLTIPLETGKEGSPTPRWADAGSAKVKLSTDKPVHLAGVPVAGKAHAVGVSDLLLDADARLAGVMGAAPTPADTSPGAPAAALPISATLSATVVRSEQAAWQGAGTTGSRVARLEADAHLAADTSTLEANARLIDIASGQVEALLGKPGLLLGALGESPRLTLGARQVTVPEAPGGAAGRKTMSASVAIDAPRLKGDPIRIEVLTDRITAQPAKLTWTPSLQWLNDTAFPAPKPTPGAPPAPGDRLAEEMTFTIDLRRLAAAIPKSEAGSLPTTGPLLPGVFALDALVTAPAAALVRADGHTLRAEDIRIAIASAPQPGAITVDAAIARISEAGAPAASKQSAVRATVTSLADERGIVTTDKAILNLNADIAAFPTALLDQLANQKGMLVDALGGTVSLIAKADNLSKTGGTLDATATSPRATAKIKGSVKDSTFIQSGPIEVNIVEIIRPLVARFAGGIPLVASVEKTPKDEPGIVRAEGLTLPTQVKSNQDLTRLNGVITVDLGTATFTTQDFFANLVRVVGQRQAGTVGRKIEPFVIRMEKGVLTYDRFRIPLGEFSLETKGTVDLVQRRIDVVTYVPFFALTDEAAGLFNTGLAGKLGGIDRATLVPISTKGSLDTPKTEIDFGTFLKELGPNIIKEPGKILEDIFKKIGK